MGISVGNIAFSCRCSTATVGTVVKRAKACGLGRPLPEEMNDAAVRAVIYPKKPKTDASKAKIDHALIDREPVRRLPDHMLAVLASGSACQAERGSDHRRSH